MSKFDELYKLAINERPEQFVIPFMPYIKCSINGIKLIALIDTGSMITCLNLETAINCDILNNMDDRIKIPVIGIGNKTSIGKNYGVDIVINGNTIIMPVTIIDISLSNCDLIIGLDLLRSFQGNIDFQKNILKLKSQYKNFETNLINEQELKILNKIKALIEICHGKIDEEHAKECLIKNNYNIDFCINEILNK